jgi:hypothetical protein
MILIIIIAIIILYFFKSSKESFTDNLDKDININYTKDNIELRTLGECHWWAYLQHIGPELCNRLGMIYHKPVSVNCPAGYAKPLCVRKIT